MLGRIYRAILSRLIHRTFGLWQALGFHVTLDYYGEPIPNTRRLAEDTWSRLSELPGIDMREEDQLALLDRFASRYRAEYEAFPRETGRARPRGPAAYCVGNPKFGTVDGEVLYCMVRDLKPRRMIEIGSGHSTLAAAQAAAKNREEDPGRECELVSNDPSPPRFLTSLPEGLPGLSRIERRRAQDIPLEELTSLGANDILFIDSTHVLKIGSDVQYEVLEVLPRLAPGVAVHIHDVFLPAEYPREWVTRHHWFFNEQYLVQAFLAHNSAFDVMWAANYMCIRHPNELAKAFPSSAPGRVTPGSLWLRKTG